MTPLRAQIDGLKLSPQHKAKLIRYYERRSREKVQR